MPMTMESRVRWRRSVPIAFLGLTLAVLLSGPTSSAGEVCDRVLCYFCGSDTAAQWRIYDPVRGTDTLFLTLSKPGTVRWDSSLTHVEYLSGSDLFVADWRFGATPHRVARLPELPSIDDWWFNPDSLCWQLWRMAPLPEGPGGPLYQDCRAELWQSSRDGTDWHLAVADTEDCQDWYYEPGFRPSFGSETYWAPRMRRVPTVTPDDLTHKVSPESPGAELVESAPECDEPMYDAPSRTVPGRWIQFRYLDDAAPEPSRVLYPVHLVDRERGTRTLLCGPDVSCPEEILSTTVSEECGLVLVVRAPELTRLVDIATGREVKLAGSSVGLKSGGLVESIYAFWGSPLKR